MLRVSILFLFLFRIFMLASQTFVETGNMYPLSVDGNKYVVSGFMTFENLKDEEIYANALLWTVENVCPKQQEGITKRDIKNKSFSCTLIFG